MATAEDEWAVLEPLIDAVEGVGTDPKRGGRPRKKLDVELSRPVSLANDVTMDRVRTDDGYAIRIRGAHVNEEIIELVMDRIRYLLEKI